MIRTEPPRENSKHVLTKLMEYSLSLSTLASDQSFGDLDQPQFQPRPNLDQSHSPSLSLLVPSADVVFWQIDRIRIALRLGRVGLACRVPSRSSPGSVGISSSRLGWYGRTVSLLSQQVVGNIVRIRQVNLSGSSGRIGLATHRGRSQDLPYSTRNTVGSDGDGIMPDGDEVGFGVIGDEEHSTETGQSRLEMFKKHINRCNHERLPV